MPFIEPITIKEAEYPIGSFLFWETSIRSAVGEAYFLTNIPNNLAKCDDCYMGIGLNSLVDF